MHGYSFHSKQVAQGPHFFNLRSMCECFGRAVHRHITFAEESGDVKWLIDEDAASFSYAFKDDLKVTTDLEKARQMHADDAPEEETASEAGLQQDPYSDDDFEPVIPEVEERDDLDIELSNQEVALVATIRQDQL